jgi:uncharacterized protein (DUF58 family)
LLAAGLAWLGLSAACVAFPAMIVVWEIAGAMLLASCLADFWLGWQEGCPLELRRQMSKNWALGVTQTVRLQLRVSGSSRRVRGRLFDGVPAAFRSVGLPREFSLANAQVEHLSYEVVAKSRGSHRFEGADVELVAPLGLWGFRYRLGILGQDREARVYPDFARIAHYTLLATDHRLSQIGLLRQRRRGEGLEFHQLREYREGDSPRQIDWKASTRQGKLISREYQDERNQQLVFLLDCGARMATREDEVVDGTRRTGLSHFDEALNAMLLLSYVALRQGDGVGLATFGHPVPRFLGPRRAQASLNQILNAVYDLEPTEMTPDFLEAARWVTNRVRKRSLIVMITNLREEDDATLLPALKLLKRQHLVVVASLREPGLSALRARPVKHFEDALAYAAASEYLYARQALMAHLRKSGVQCLDVAPSELPIGLVNEYWKMKRRGVL